MSGLAGTVMRVLTWNVQCANPVRADRQRAWLLRVAPDVIVLTEVSAGATGELLARWLEEAGYHVHLPEPGADRYRVLLAARGLLEPVDTGITVMPHRAVTAKVKSTSGADLTVTGLYVPSRGPAAQRNVAKRDVQDAVAAALPSLASTAEPSVLAGDLNVVEPCHVPHHRVFGQWEYDFYRAFAAAGYCDAFRLRHPDLIEHSWYGRVTKHGTRNGYRFDHTFITTEHRGLVADCSYQHRPRLNQLSDHSAMILTLRL